MVTIKDVAKRAGVSVSTTSRTLTESGYVSSLNKEKVLKAAQELGYVANVNATQLKQKNLGIIGLIISDISNPYFTEFVKELREKLKDTSYDLLLTVSNNNKQEEARQIKYLIGCKVSKILLIPSSSNNRDVIELAKRNDIEVIQLFISVYPDLPSIVNDDSEGTFQAAKLLCQEGYKRIGLLDVLFDPDNYQDVFPKRSDGFKKAENLYSDVKMKIFTIESSIHFSEKTIKDLEEFNPDALIAGTGLLGLGTLKYLKATSRKIKLISFDNNEWFEYLGITSINQSKQKLVNTVLNVLLSNDETMTNNIKIEESLVLRK